MRTRPSRLFWLIAGVYLLAFPYHPGLRSPNELCRLWQARAIVERGALSLNATMRDYGYVGDLSIKDGRLYPSKAPLLSFLAAPLYAALSAMGLGGHHPAGEVAQVYVSRLFLTVLPTLWLLWLLLRFLRQYVSPETAEAVVATYALGSLGFSYSLLFLSHQPSAVLLFASFYALWSALHGRWGAGGYALAGTLAGAALTAEYTSALGILALGIYGTAALLGRREVPVAQRIRSLASAAGWGALGALPWVAGLMVYHQVCFGGPWETGYRHLNDAAYQPWHLGGFLGIRTPDPQAFLLSFFSPLRGLFALSPFLLCGLWGWGALRRAVGRSESSADRALLWLTGALWLGYAYFTSSFSYQSWGWTTGPRHLTPLVPFLLLPAALLLEAAGERTRRGGSGAGLGLRLGVASGLALASVWITGLSSLVNYVPDVVSTPLFGLTLPLFRSGSWPPSLLLLVVPNPWSGGLLVGAVCIAGLWTLALMLRPALKAPAATRARAVLAATATAGLLLAALASVSGTPADGDAQRHLRSVWSAR